MNDTNHGAIPTLPDLYSLASDIPPEDRAGWAWAHLEPVLDAWDAIDEDTKGDAFDLAIALYYHCAHFHGGMYSERYAILSGLGRHGLRVRGTEPDMDTVYDMLADPNVEEPTMLEIYAWLGEDLC